MRKPKDIWLAILSTPMILIGFVIGAAGILFFVFSIYRFFEFVKNWITQ